MKQKHYIYFVPFHSNLLKKIIIIKKTLMFLQLMKKKPLKYPEIFNQSPRGRRFEVAIRPCFQSQSQLIMFQLLSAIFWYRPRSWFMLFHKSIGISWKGSLPNKSKAFLYSVEISGYTHTVASGLYKTVCCL